MSGNVRELCQNWYQKQMVEETDPKGPIEGTYKSVRGGSWDHKAKDCRSAKRDTLIVDSSSGNVGFRIAA